MSAYTCSDVFGIIDSYVREMLWNDLNEEFKKCVLTKNKTTISGVSFVWITIDDERKFSITIRSVEN